MARNLSNAAASLLPYSTIEAAASGNVDAINAVLKHYERYIAALATRTLYDENGVPHLYLEVKNLGNQLGSHSAYLFFIKAKVWNTVFII